MADNEVKMMMSVYPGAMTGFAALNAGLVSINNIFGNVMRAFDKQFDLLDTAIMTTGVVVTQLGVDAMSAFGEFEQGMKIVQMVSGQTAQDISYLSQKANEFSIQYRTDIDQITEGLQTLGRAGLNSASEQAEVLQNGLNTAKLEGRDLNSVLEELIQNTALLGGNLKSSSFGEDSEYINDLLVATSMSAPITTHDVSETLKYSGGIAAAAGANIESDSGKAILEDYMGAIAAFAQKGVTGSIAGTALRAFFNKPATQDSSVKEALASIKLKPEYLWEDDEETMKPVSEQIGLIQSQMDELDVSTMDRLQIWSKIVGGKMGQQMMKLDSDDIKTLTKDIRAADDASDLATKSMKTYQANVKALGESGAALQRDVGEKLVYFVNPILEFINKFTGFLDNDIGASVLATSVIAFVGALTRRILSVIKIVKGELATLLSGAKYHLGKYAGTAIGPNGELLSNNNSKTSQKAPKNLMEHAKQYYGFSGQSTIESLRKNGMNDADIARIGIFSTLKKDSTGLGMTDAEFVKKIYPRLSSTHISQMDSLIRAAGGASRKPFDQMFLDSNGALKKEFTDLIRKTYELENATNAASKSLKAFSSKRKLKLEDGYSYGLKGKNGLTTFDQINERVQTEKFLDKQEKQLINTLRERGLSELKEREEMKRKNESLSKMRYGYYNLPYQKPSSTEQDVFSNLGKRSPHIIQEYYKSGLGIYGIQDDKGMLNTIAQARIKNWESLSDKVKETHLKQLSIYPDIGRNNQIGPALYGSPVPKGATYGPVYGGVGSGVGSVPALEDEVRRTQEALNKLRNTINKVANAPAGLKDKGITTQKEIDDIRRKSKEEYNKNQRASSTERDRKKFQEDRSRNSNLITSRNAIKDIQDRSKKEYEENQKVRDQAKKTLADAQKASKERADRVRQMRYERIAPTYPKPTPKTLYPVTKVPTGEHSPEDINNTLRAYGLAPMKTTKIDNAVDKIKDSGFYKNFTDRLNRDRSGSFLSFGSTTVNGVTRSATKGLSGLANKALNLSDAFGGPLMIAIIAVTAAIQMWQQAFQKYCEDLKEAGNKLKDAYSEWESAENSLEKSYQEANPDATSDEIDQMVYDTYGTMTDTMQEAVAYGDDTSWLNKINSDAAKQPTYEYDQEADDGSVKIVEEQIDSEAKLQESIKENTGALYRATSEVSMALDNYVRQGTDSWWGIDGWTGQLTDAFGAISDFKGWWRMFAGGAWLSGLMDIVNDAITDNHFTSNRSKFMDDQEFLLTARQKDENYAGNTEMAGLMLQDFKDAGGNWLAGMQTMMGEDAITFSHVISSEAKEFLDAEANFASRLTQRQNLKLQTSMKNDSKTWKNLAKEIVKNEMKTGKKTSKENQTKKIEGLIKKLSASMGNEFSHTQILQAAYLQIMQGMLETAKAVIVPIIAQNAQIAAQTMYNSSGIDQKANQGNSTTAGIEGINSSIAAMVSQIAMAKSADATYNAILMQDPSKLSGDELAAYNLAQQSSDGQDFLKKAANASYAGSSFNIDWGKGLAGAYEGMGFGAGGMIAGFSKGVTYNTAKENQKAMDDILTNFGMTALQQVYGYDSVSAQNKVSKAIQDWREAGASSQQIYESLSKNYQTDRFYKQLNNAYINSGEDAGEGSGGGSGSGSGSGDKNNNTGTRRERVDLVLCNKKEIPKLNVNLFKKPPSFTILNKNFKLRDVKINSQDKPKAIMAAIKNSFIDIQKRTDPKIIQDEDAVYDPKAATDGTNVPSGSAKTKTDNNNN